MYKDLFFLKLWYGICLPATLTATLAPFLLIVSIPGLVPRVHKVNDEDQLDQDEQEPANHTDHHPRFFKAAQRDPERADHTCNWNCSDWYLI